MTGDSKTNTVEASQPPAPDQWARKQIIQSILPKNYADEDGDHSKIQVDTEDQLLSLVCLLALAHASGELDGQAGMHFDMLRVLRGVGVDAASSEDLPQSRAHKRLASLSGGWSIDKHVAYQAHHVMDSSKSMEYDSCGTAVEESVDDEALKGQSIKADQFRDKIAAMQSLGGGYAGLVQDVARHPQALGWKRFYAKQALIWSMLVLYALGCGLAVMGGLLSKFLQSILGWSSVQSLASLLLPGFGVLALSTFTTNIKIMKADVEAFVDGWFYQDAPRVAAEAQSWGQWAKETLWPTFKTTAFHALLGLTSLLVAAVLALMTWHYAAAWLPAAVVSPVAITVAVATFVTEAILTYNLLKDYWIPFWQGLFSKEGFAEGSPWYAIQQNYRKKCWGKLRKVVFWLGLLIVGSFVIFGMIALSMSGIKAMDDVSFLHSLPQVVDWVLLGISVIAQLPIYIAPLCHLLCGLFSGPSRQQKAGGAPGTARNRLSRWARFKASVTGQALRKHGVKIVLSSLLAGGLSAGVMWTVADVAFMASPLGVAMLVASVLAVGLLALQWARAAHQGSKITRTVSEHYGKLIGYALLGTGACAIALGCVAGWSALLQPPVLIAMAAAGMVYGAWMLLNLHYKGLPNYARIGSNAFGNGALAEPTFTDTFIKVPYVGPVLAFTADFFNSFLCGTYGDKDGLTKQDEATRHAIELYQKVRPGVVIVGDGSALNEDAENDLGGSLEIYL